MLDTGCQIQLSAYSVTGQSYPYLIQVWNVLKVGSTEWEPLIDGAPYGYLDLDIAGGVLPKDRALITAYV